MLHLFSVLYQILIYLLQSHKHFLEKQIILRHKEIVLQFYRKIKKIYTLFWIYSPSESIFSNFFLNSQQIFFKKLDYKHVLLTIFSSFPSFSIKVSHVQQLIPLFVIDQTFSFRFVSGKEHCRYYNSKFYENLLISFTSRGVCIRSSTFS